MMTFGQYRELFNIPHLTINDFDHSESTAKYTIPNTDRIGDIIIYKISGNALIAFNGLPFKIWGYQLLADNTKPVSLTICKPLSNIRPYTIYVATDNGDYYHHFFESDDDSASFDLDNTRCKYLFDDVEEAEQTVRQLNSPKKKEIFDMIYDKDESGNYIKSYSIIQPCISKIKNPEEFNDNKYVASTFVRRFYIGDLVKFPGEHNKQNSKKCYRLGVIIGISPATDSYKVYTGDTKSEHINSEFLELIKRAPPEIQESLKNYQVEVFLPPKWYYQFKDYMNKEVDAYNKQLRSAFSVFIPAEIRGANVED